jgi:secreted trypsin-like serine protease
MFLKSNFVLPFAFFYVLLTVGCQNQTQSNLINSEIALDKNSELQNYILGGKVLPKELLKGSHTVGISNNHSNQICNGVILDNDLILTVAHCLVDRSVDSDIEIRFGLNIRNNYISRIAKKVITDNGYRNKGNEMEWNDVAIIFIDGQIPEGFSATHDIAPYPYKYSQNQQLLIQGFGISDLSNDDSWGQLQFGWAQIYTNDYSKNEFTIVQRSSTHCEGDSGGPAYEFHGDGQKMFLAGIVRGGGYLMGAGRCGKSHYTSSYKIIEFLKEKVNRQWVKDLPHEVSMEDSLF